MDKDIWNEKAALIDMLLDTNKSLIEIAEYFECSKIELSKRIKAYGLEWIRRPSRKMSRGQTALTSMMKKLIPNHEIVNEFHIGEKLRLDVYCPSYKLAAEYHGRQHYVHIPAFHETYDDFLRSQERDRRKLELCKENDIVLVSFKYSDELTEDAVYDRLLQALRLSSSKEIAKTIKPKTSLSNKNSPYYEEAKLKRKDFERDLRKKIKQERKLREQGRTPEDESADCIPKDYDY